MKRDLITSAENDSVFKRVKFFDWDIKNEIKQTKTTKCAATAWMKVQLCQNSEIKILKSCSMPIKKEISKLNSQFQILLVKLKINPKMYSNLPISVF